MSSTLAPTPLTLEVQFTGLCLHVQHRDERNGTRPEVAVLLPDARFRGETRRHPDRTPAVSHAGYLRVDLAHVAPDLPGATIPPGERPPDGRGITDGPHFEVVYRLGDMADRFTGGQTLDFGIEDDGTSMTAETQLPSFDNIAPGHRVRPDLFTKLAGANVAEGIPSPLLLRTLLRGGDLRPSVEGVSVDLWSIDAFLSGGSNGPIVGRFPGAVTWRREIKPPNPQDKLTLTFSSFDGTETVKLPLWPKKDSNVIKLKIANLCAENPLEWNELELRTATLEDSDFKWFYQLLDPTASSWRKFLEDRALAAATAAGGTAVDPTPIVPRQLPAPRLVTQPTEGRITDLGVQNCAPSSATMAFPAFSQWTL